MKSMNEKYYNDYKYKRCVDMMESMICSNEFTPSEIREMAVLACINYEMKRTRNYVCDDPKIETALNTLQKISETKGM